jgi:transposase
MSRGVKRAYRYRFYPTPAQADALNRTFGCVRLVYNKALVRHEAPPFPGRGGRSLRSVCRSRLAKLRAVQPRRRAGG